MRRKIRNIQYLLEVNIQKERNIEQVIILVLIMTQLSTVNLLPHLMFSKIFLPASTSFMRNHWLKVALSIVGLIYILQIRNYLIQKIFLYQLSQVIRMYIKDQYMVFQAVTQIIHMLLPEIHCLLVMELKKKGATIVYYVTLVILHVQILLQEELKRLITIQTILPSMKAQLVLNIC